MSKTRRGPRRWSPGDAWTAGMKAAAVGHSARRRCEICRRSLPPAGSVHICLARGAKEAPSDQG